MHPLWILLAAVIAVFVLIIRWKINAFIALILSAILTGVLSSGALTGTFAPDGPLVPYTAFFGDPSFALILYAAAAMWVLERQKGYSYRRRRTITRFIS